MSDVQYACIPLDCEDQYSVVPTSDVMGDVNEGDKGTVTWWIVGKGKKVDTKWYKAKILKYSGKFYSLSNLTSQ